MSSVAVSPDLLSSTLEADVIVPSQFFDRIRSEESSQPEKRLMLAVMENAISTFQRSIYQTNRRQRRLLKETEAWTNSSDDHWPFSFENICAALDIESDYLRAGLLRWKLDRLSAPADQARPTVHSPFRRVSGRRHALSRVHSRAPKARAA